MSRTLEADITVLGGLPVTVEYTVQPAEKDVGIMGPYVEEYWITYVGTRRVKSEPKWLTERIAKTKGEEDRIYQKLNELDNDYEWADY